MQRQVYNWCQWALDSWAGATLYDYAFAMAWVILVGYLISKVTSYSTR